MTDLPHKHDSVPVAFTMAVMAEAEERGLDVSAALRAAGLDRRQLSDKSKQISFEAQHIVIAELGHGSIPGFGLLVGQRVNIADWGILGYAFISSPNLRHGLNVFCTYQRLNCPMVNIYLTEDGDEGILSAVEAFPLGDLHRFAFEEWLAETHAILRRLELQGLMMSKVCLTYPEPACAPQYRELFSCPVYFGQETNSVHFPANALNLPFTMADKAVSELCIQQCEKVLRNLAEEDPIVDAVRRVLLTNPGITPTLAMVAEHLHISSRTLRRRLNEAGTSYKNILNDVRLGLAAEYLRSSRMAPKQIAYLLGYSGVTSFHRAFKNQFENTPVEYRALHTTEGVM